MVAHINLESYFRGQLKSLKLILWLAVSVESGAFIVCLE